MTPTNVVDSLHACLAFSPRDWGANKRDAWLWGIICGWDAESLDELRVRFRWSAAEVARLRKLRQNSSRLGVRSKHAPLRCVLTRVRSKFIAKCH